MFKKTFLGLSAAALVAIPSVASANPYYNSYTGVPHSRSYGYAGGSYGTPYGGYYGNPYGYGAYGSYGAYGTPYNNRYYGNRYNRHRNGNATGAIVGGLIGAVIGSQIGNGGHHH